MDRASRARRRPEPRLEIAERECPLRVGGGSSALSEIPFGPPRARCRSSIRSLRVDSTCEAQIPPGIRERACPGRERRLASGPCECRLTPIYLHDAASTGERRERSGERERLPPPLNSGRNRGVSLTG